MSGLQLDVGKRTEVISDAPGAIARVVIFTELGCFTVCVSTLVHSSIDRLSQHFFCS